MQIAALVVVDPRLGLDEHGQVARVQWDGVLGEARRDGRVETDDAELLATHVLVCLVERRLLLRAMGCEHKHKEEETVPT
jgi:hypothetical protein